MGIARKACQVGGGRQAKRKVASSAPMANGISAGTRMMERVIIEAKKRRAKALALYKGGLTVEEVGDRLKVSKQRASELIAKARKEATA